MSSSPPAPRLLDRVAAALLRACLPETTRQCFLHRIREFVFFHRGRRPEDRPDNRFRHPADMGAAEVGDDLADLATRRLSLSEQAQGRSALVFLYERVLGLALGEIVVAAPPSAAPKLLDCVRAALRLGHYSLATEEAYVKWIKRFILFHHKRHPRDMGAAEIESFLTHLAAERDVSASTQNQAFNALLFLYQRVLEIELPRLDALRATRPKRLPVVLSRAEVRRLLDAISGANGAYRLMASLLSGAGLRLIECCRLLHHRTTMSADHRHQTDFLGPAAITKHSADALTSPCHLVTPAPYPLPPRQRLSPLPPRPPRPRARGQRTAHPAGALCRWKGRRVAPARRPRQAG